MYLQICICIKFAYSVADLGQTQYGNLSSKGVIFLAYKLSGRVAMWQVG